MSFNESNSNVGFDFVPEVNAQNESSQNEHMGIAMNPDLSHKECMDDTIPEVEVPEIEETDESGNSVTVSENATDESTKTEQSADTTENLSDNGNTLVDVCKSEKAIVEEKDKCTDGITVEQTTELLKPLHDDLKSIQDSLTDVNARVSSLRKLADMHESIENKLNAQINEYKDNLYRRIVNPILVEFFDVQEDMIQEMSEATDETGKILNEYIENISRILRHYGVTVEIVNEGDVYDSRIHKPVKAVHTSEKDNDKRIAKTRKRLVHSIDGKVVERASVHVYQYRESANDGKETNEQEKTTSLANI